MCSRDTDVLVLLTYHRTANEVGMEAGTKSKPRYIPVREVRESLPANVFHNLRSLHAVTGCDSTSQFCGHDKKSVWQARTLQSLAF